MGQLAFEYEVLDRLRGRPYLRPVFTSIYHIPERLREYDPALFVVYNVDRGVYEVHSLNHKGNTYALDVPWCTLDARLIERVRRHDLRLRPNLFREIEEHNERVRLSRQRSRRNDLAGIAEELRPAFKHFAFHEMTRTGAGV